MQNNLQYNNFRCILWLLLIFRFINSRNNVTRRIRYIAILIYIYHTKTNWYLKVTKETQWNKVSYRLFCAIRAIVTSYYFYLTSFSFMQRSLRSLKNSADFSISNSTIANCAAFIVILLNWSKKIFEKKLIIRTFSHFYV